MNKGQTAIMLAAAWLLLILLLSGCGCGAPVWKAVPCTSEPADAEFYIINDQGFEVEGRYLLEAYLEVDSSGASFTFRGIFGRELLSGTEFNIEISQGGSTWKLSGVRQGSCIVLPPWLISMLNSVQLKSSRPNMPLKVKAAPELSTSR